MPGKVSSTRSRPIRVNVSLVCHMPPPCRNGSQDLIDSRSGLIRLKHLEHSPGLAEDVIYLLDPEPRTLTPQVTQSTSVDSVTSTHTSQRNVTMPITSRAVTSSVHDVLICSWGMARVPPPRDPHMSVVARRPHVPSGRDISRVLHMGLRHPMVPRIRRWQDGKASRVPTRKHPGHKHKCLY
jgi:hypothetical protein